MVQRHERQRCEQGHKRWHEQRQAQVRHRGGEEEEEEEEEEGEAEEQRLQGGRQREEQRPLYRGHNAAARAGVAAARGGSSGKLECRTRRRHSAMPRVCSRGPRRRGHNRPRRQRTTILEQMSSTSAFTSPWARGGTHLSSVGKTIWLKIAASVAHLGGSVDSPDGRFHDLERPHVRCMSCGEEQRASISGVRL